MPIADKPTKNLPVSTVNFRKLLLNRCQKEFEKDKVDDVVFERKQKELDSAASVRAPPRPPHSVKRQQPGKLSCSVFSPPLQTTERDRLQEELEEAKDKARRRSIGNIKFIGELFKLKMLTEAIMHDCVVKLLKHHDAESLECLCRLLTTIGKDLDFEKAKVSRDRAAMVCGLRLPAGDKRFLCMGLFKGPIILKLLFICASRTDNKSFWLVGHSRF